MNTEFRVGVVTPYLTGSVLEDYKDDENELRLQVGLFGAQDMRGDLKGFEEQEQGVYKRGRQTIDMRDWNDDERYAIFAAADLAVVGCTRDAEQDVYFAKSRESGFVIARCSTFYGRESGYTQISAADAGYAFDVPKAKDVVYKFLTNEEIAKGILARDLSKVVEETKALNSELAKAGRPTVLATEYLERALQIPHKRSREIVSRMVRDEEWQQNQWRSRWE
ncbi:hypothetical protein CL620_02955 [archaeon]|nr:hypothetical protein [archaeon]